MNYFHQLRERLFRKPNPSLQGGAGRAERGTFGEDLAAEYCRKELGFRIIVRNWRCKRDEIDIVCRDGAVLVFVEVRARSETALISGFHSVNRHKKEILRRVFGNYLRQLQKPPKHFRFDIIDVCISKEGRGLVRHYENVPLFHKHFSAQKL